MTTSSCGSSLSTHFHSTTHKILSVWAAMALLLFSANSFAQPAITDALPDAPSALQASSPPQQTPASAQDQITLPAGTRLTLVLSSAVNSREMHSGDQISAQVTVPVLINDRVAVPAGTYLQGKAETLTRRGTRAEMLMQSASLVFPNGYIANINTPVKIESDEWTAANNPSGGSKAAIILAPMLAVPLGALIGHAADGNQTSTFAGMTISTPTHKGLVIGTVAGFVAGLGTSFALMAHSHGFFVDAGAPLSMALPQPVSLDQGQVDDAIQKAPTQPPVPVARRPVPPPVVDTTTDHGTCYTPGSPGTPDVVIPGTPPIGDSPGTPPTVIPGIPATPPTPYPCPF